jgi:SAM-dependent methyltransferase
VGAGSSAWLQQPYVGLRAMIRYALAAGALKAFSLNGTTRTLYRRVGNVLGSRRRIAKLDLATYVSRGDLLVALVKKYSAAQDSPHLLEIGTGWMHWFALYLRLFIEAEIATVDVWDNRQLNALKSAFEQLQPTLLARNLPAKVHENLRTILTATDFADLYERLGLSYLIQNDGALTAFADASCDCVFSFHVLEHVNRASVSRLCAEMHRVLVPNGFAIHQIGIGDHLYHYDPSCSQKQYLAYSDRAWRLFFENGVQYINRLQMSDWLEIFRKAGFVVSERLPVYVDLTGLRIDRSYSGYDKQDLACTNLTLVLQKPPVFS